MPQQRISQPEQSRAKRHAARDVDPATSVFNELQRRVLNDLETCRQVWERERDPVALCEAVRQVDLPPWLADALLVFLTDGQVVGRLLVGRLSVAQLWRNRSRSMLDAARAMNVAGARSKLEVSWEKAYALGEELVRRQYGDVPVVGIAGAKRSYAVVRRNLALKQARYYRPRAGMQERIVQAWSNTTDHLESALKEGEGGRGRTTTTSKPKRGRPRRVKFTIEQFTALQPEAARPLSLSQLSDLSGFSNQKLCELIKGNHINAFRVPGFNQYFVEYVHARKLLSDLRLIEPLSK